MSRTDGYTFDIPVMAVVDVTGMTASEVVGVVVGEVGGVVAGVTTMTIVAVVIISAVLTVVAQGVVDVMKMSMGTGAVVAAGVLVSMIALIVEEADMVTPACRGVIMGHLPLRGGTTFHRHRLLRLLTW